MTGLNLIILVAQVQADQNTQKITIALYKPLLEL